MYFVFARTCFLMPSSHLAGVLLSLQQGVLNNFIANLYLLCILSCWQAEMASEDHKHYGWCGSQGLHLDTCMYPSPQELHTRLWHTRLWSLWALWCLGAEPGLPLCHTPPCRPHVVSALKFLQLPEIKNILINWTCYLCKAHSLFNIDVFSQNQF